MDLIDADGLDYYHQLARDRIHLLLIDDARRGLADIEAGRTYAADAALEHLQQQRGAAAAASRKSAAKACKPAKKRGQGHPCG